MQPGRIPSLGFIGAGNMAEALLRGALAAQLLPPEHVTAFDPMPNRQQLFRDELKVCMAADCARVASQADMLLLCVKPQQCATALQDLKPHFNSRRHLLVSILAGITTSRLESGLPDGARVVRVMPNTPMLVGLGACGMCPGRHASEADLGTVESLLRCASLVTRVDEPLLDAVTGLSGSGPAYLFYLVEAMAEAGVAEGLAPEDALKLATRTCLGAAKMLEQTGTAPAELRRRVTSPNGTTQAAVEVLDSGEVKKRLVDAVRRAAERSRELSRS